MANYDSYIIAAANKYGVDANLIKAMIQVESSGDPKAVSSAGAKGLMQLLPSTFESMGVGTDIFDPETNINAGAKYLSQLLDKAGNNRDKALAMYNAGPGNVEKYGYEKYSAYYNKVNDAYWKVAGTDSGSAGTGSSGYTAPSTLSSKVGLTWWGDVVKVVFIILLIATGAVFLSLAVTNNSPLSALVPSKEESKKALDMIGGAE